MEEQATYQTDPMQSPDIGKLAEALAKAQSEMEGAKKDGNNPFFKSDYSTLFSVWQACRGPLTRNGLSVVQPMGSNGEDAVTVFTTLMHSSGQWLKSALSITPGKAGPQELGSCITYLRRYSLAAMVGLSPLDDDGEAAMQKNRKEPEKSTTKTKPTTPKDPPKKETPIQTMIKKFAKAKEVLNKKTGSDEIYYAGLDTLGVKHANEIKKVEDGNKLLAEFRTFLKGGDNDKNKTASEAPGNNAPDFPPEEN